MRVYANALPDPTPVAVSDVVKSGKPIWVVDQKGVEVKLTPVGLYGAFRVKLPQHETISNDSGRPTMFRIQEEKIVPGGTLTLTAKANQRTHSVYKVIRSKRK